jgi:hypothetical protein
MLAAVFSVSNALAETAPTARHLVSILASIALSRNVTRASSAIATGSATRATPIFTAVGTEAAFADEMTALAATGAAFDREDHMMVAATEVAAIIEAATADIASAVLMAAETPLLTITAATLPALGTRPSVAVMWRAVAIVATTVEVAVASVALR